MIKNKILPTSLQGNYGDSLGEFSNTSYHYGVVGAERVNPILHGGGGGQKVPALISKICIFATNTATATKFGDFS